MIEPDAAAAILVASPAVWRFSSMISQGAEDVSVEQVRATMLLAAKDIFILGLLCGPIFAACGHPDLGIGLAINGVAFLLWRQWMLRKNRNSDNVL